MPDLSSEEFDFTPKEGPLKIVSINHDFYLIPPYYSLNKIRMNILRNAIFGQHFAFTPKILDITGNCPLWLIKVTRGQFLNS